MMLYSKEIEFELSNGYIISEFEHQSKKNKVYTNKEINTSILLRNFKIYKSSKNDIENVHLECQGKLIDKFIGLFGTDTNYSDFGCVLKEYSLIEEKKADRNICGFYISPSENRELILLFIYLKKNVFFEILEYIDSGRKFSLLLNINTAQKGVYINDFLIKLLHENVIQGENKKDLIDENRIVINEKINWDIEKNISLIENNSCDIIYDFSKSNYNINFPKVWVGKQLNFQNCSTYLEQSIQVIFESLIEFIVVNLLLKNNIYQARLKKEKIELPFAEYSDISQDLKSNVHFSKIFRIFVEITNEFLKKNNCTEQEKIEKLDSFSEIYQDLIENLHVFFHHIQETHKSKIKHENNLNALSFQFLTNEIKSVFSIEESKVDWYVDIRYDEISRIAENYIRLGMCNSVGDALFIQCLLFADIQKSAALRNAEIDLRDSIYKSSIGLSTIRVFNNFFQKIPFRIIILNSLFFILLKLNTNLDLVKIITNSIIITYILGIFLNKNEKIIVKKNYIQNKMSLFCDLLFKEIEPSFLLNKMEEEFLKKNTVTSPLICKLVKDSILENRTLKFNYL